MFPYCMRGLYMKYVFFFRDIHAYYENSALLGYYQPTEEMIRYIYLYNIYIYIHIDEHNLVLIHLIQGGLIGNLPNSNYLIILNRVRRTSVFYDKSID